MFLKDKQERYVKIFHNYADGLSSKIVDITVELIMVVNKRVVSVGTIPDNYKRVA